MVEDVSISQVIGLLGLRALNEASRRRGAASDDGPAEAVVIIVGRDGE